METFNELVTMGTIYLLMLFTDFVPRPEERHLSGFFLIGLVSVYALVHVGLLSIDTFKKVRHQIKRCIRKRNFKRLFAKYKK